MKVDEFKDQLQILNTKLEKNKETIFKITKHGKKQKNLLKHILSYSKLPEYLKEMSLIEEKIKIIREDQLLAKEILDLETHSPFDSLQPTKFNINHFLIKAYENKNLSENTKATFEHRYMSFGSYKRAHSIQALFSNLPKRPIYTLDQWLLKHPILLPQFPSFDSFSSTIDLNKTSFQGPFVNMDNQMVIEQQKVSAPLFVIQWDPQNKYGLSLFFYKWNDRKNYIYSLLIRNSQIQLQENISQKVFIKYAVNQDGSLGAKLI